MKKTVTLLLSAFLLVCSLAACGDQTQEMNSSNHVSLEDATDTVESTALSEMENNNEPAVFSEAVNGGEADDSPETQNVQQSADSTDGSNILIVYFSRYGNTEYPDDVDATTSASIVADGTGRYGTTEYVADITYCEAHHNMAIFYAQTDRPDLSVDVIPIGRVTSDLSVFDGLDSREEITFSLAQ